MKIKITVVAALVAAVGCGAFAADVGAKVNGTALPSDASGNVQWPVGDGVTAEWHDCILSFTGSGKVKMTIEVDESTDLKTWKHAKTVDLAVPVKGEKGYYILKPK